MTDPVEWLPDLRRDSDPRLEDFEAFSEEMQKMYGDKDRKLNAAMKCMTDFLQGANEPVRVYANRIKANWRAAGWLPQDNKNLYEIAWSGLRPGLKSKIKPLTPKNGRFDSMEELFDRAANSEVKLDGKKPQPQQPQQQQRQSGELSSQQGGKKRKVRPSISEPAKAPTPDQSKSDNDDIHTPEPWVSPELYETRKSEGQCIRCGSPKHKTFWCTKYTCANFPENLAPPRDGNKSNISAPSIVNNQKTSLPLSVPSSAGEDGRTGAWIAVIGYEGVDGNIRGNSTVSDFTKAEGCLTEPESVTGSLLISVMIHDVASKYT
jgi:hypothetical protein